MAASPHILLIMMDELRRDALSCCGAVSHRTPHLDVLADVSTRFDNARTVSPLCLPARWSMANGLWPHHSGAYSNFRPCPVSPDRPNIYNQLRSAGYYTAHIGKCHYSPAPYHLTRPDATIDREPVRDLYMSMGMDHLDLCNGKNNSIWFWNDYSRDMEAEGLLEGYRNAVWDKRNGNVLTFPGPADWHPDAWVGRKAIESIEHAPAGRPTFTFVSFSGPHYPFDPPAEYLERVDPSAVGLGAFDPRETEDPTKIQYHAWHGGRPGRFAESAGKAPDHASLKYPDEYWRKLRWHYFANVVQIDEWIGRVMEAARARFGEDLVVLFTTDHGENAGEHRLWGKNNCGFECVLRVPLFLHTPGQKTGRTSRSTVLNIDILPTLLELAGAPAIPCDGRSLLVSVDGGGYPVTFSEAENFLTICDGRYKYIQAQPHDHPQIELYDLAADPDEFHNLAGDPASATVLARLRQAGMDHFMSTTLA